MRTLLVHSSAPVGRSMSSPGIRCYRIAEALADDFRVTLMVPNEPDAEPRGVDVVQTPAGAGVVARELRRFDVVLAQRLPLRVLRRLRSGPPRLIFDLYTPALPEGLAALESEDAPRRLRLLVEAEAQAQLVALAAGDAFVCTSERQRDLWLGSLAALGRLTLSEFRHDPTLRALVDVVPFGVPPGRPRTMQPVLKGVVPGIGLDDHVLLWAGGVLGWTDAETPIRAVAHLSRRRDDVKLFFLGFGVGTAAARGAQDLARELGALDRSIFFGTGWVPYEERDAYFVESDLGVAGYYDILESRFAYRARLLDYVWAGLPMITTRTDVLGELVGSRGLGRAVRARDVDGWAAAIEELLDPAARAAAVEAAEALRTELAWERVVEPLRRLANDPEAGAHWPAAPLVLRDVAARLRVSRELRGVAGLVDRQARRVLGARR